MIESVAVRQQGAYDFETHYNNLCALQSSCPSPAVKAHLSEGVLDVNGDRIRLTDWVPILNSIRINKTLTFIAIRSYFQTNDDDDKRVGVRKKTPGIRSKEITYRLCKSLKECMSVTPTLTCIELQGLPLRERDLATLSKGLTVNSTLTHLSLEYSAIGDDGLDVICKGVKNSPSVTSLNFTGCALSWKGAGVLATVIKHQAMKRHNEAWQDSLRYRRPDLDRMSGIRRITLNSNPMLGEKGALALAEALKDDLWLKALDLQQCGLNNTGAQALLDVLKYNTTIVVLDVRQNPLIDQDGIRSIMEQVMINCNGQDTEYKWIRADVQGSSGKGAKSKKKRTKTLQSSFGKKTTIKVTTSNPRRRSKSATSISRALQPMGSESVKPGPGMPWRTALRADRYRGYQPHHEAGQSSLYECLSGTSSPESPSRAAAAGYTSGDMTETGADLSDSDYVNTKQGMVELEQLRRRFREESIARSRADAQVVEVENQRLRHQVEVLEAGGAGGLLDDDRVLDNIERSFQQFHAFLDMLQEAGLGQLISLAGLDQSRMPFNRSDLQAARAPYGSASRTQLNRQGAAPDAQSAPPADISIQPPGGAISLSHSSDPSGSGQQKSAAPVSQSGSQGKISLVPENRRHGDDPTLQASLDGGSGSKNKNRFDELYAKVLRETDGAISDLRAEADASSHVTADDRKEGDPSEHSVRSTSQRQASQHSHKSQSRHSSHKSSTRGPLQQSSNNALNSQGSQRSAGRSPGKSAAGRTPEPVSDLHEYSADFDPTPSDISEDIENIQDIHDLLPAPDTSPVKGYGTSGDDSF